MVTRSRSQVSQGGRGCPTKSPRRKRRATRNPRSSNPPCRRTWLYLGSKRSPSRPSPSARRGCGKVFAAQARPRPWVFRGGRNGRTPEPATVWWRALDFKQSRKPNTTLPAGAGREAVAIPSPLCYNMGVDGRPANAQGYYLVMSIRLDSPFSSHGAPTVSDHSPLGALRPGVVLRHTPMFCVLSDEPPGRHPSISCRARPAGRGCHGRPQQGCRRQAPFAARWRR